MKLCFLTFLWLGPRNVGLFKDEKIRSQTLELNSHYQPTICSKRNSGGWSQQQRRDIKNRRRVERNQNPGWRMGCIQTAGARKNKNEWNNLSWSISWCRFLLVTCPAPPDQTGSNAVRKSCVDPGDWQGMDQFWDYLVLVSIYDQIHRLVELGV